jgi:hypothetical protein
VRKMQRRIITMERGRVTDDGKKRVQRADATVDTKQGTTKA